MRWKPSIFVRLLTAPAVAALAVVFLAGLSVLDLTRSRNAAEDEDERARREALKAPAKKDLVPIAANVPELSEEEALRSLKERPNRASVKRLWPLENHREELFGLLSAKGTPEEARLYLLGAFDEAAPKKALEAAREILKEKDLREGPLLLSAFEILSRHGGKDDLVHFSERPGETHQLRTLREEYRDQLEGQIR